jgi:hypothetical protein
LNSLNETEIRIPVGGKVLQMRLTQFLEGWAVHVVDENSAVRPPGRARIIAYDGGKVLRALKMGDYLPTFVAHITNP